MPAQKRTSENLEDDSHQRHHYQHRQQRVKEEEEDDDEEEQEGEEVKDEESESEKEESESEGGGGGGGGSGGEGEDSDGTPSSSSDGDDNHKNNNSKDEFICVKLSEIRKEVQCPICLGIIRKTRTVMECLHRFCRECIDKSMRLGNNECPACRTHCASRRSLRDDPNYDALIAALYPDIDKYEEEVELAFHEEEKSRNKQIQASIAQTLRRQSEALVKRRTSAKATAAAFVRKSRRGRGRNTRCTEVQGTDDDEDGNGNEGGRESSSADERCIDFKQKRQKRWSGSRFSQPSSAAANAEGGSDENDELEVTRENASASPGLVVTPEVLAWGKGGVRSHTRYGSLSGNNGKNSRGNRINKLVDYLKNLEENDEELDVQLTLVPLDERSMRSLHRPYLCCRPTLSVGSLCEFVALQTSVEAEDIEILAVKEPLFTTPKSQEDPSTATNHMIPRIDPCKDELQKLKPKDTLAELQTNCTSSQGHLVLAYQRKVMS